MNLTRLGLDVFIRNVELDVSQQMNLVSLDLDFWNSIYRTISEQR